MLGAYLSPIATGNGNCFSRRHPNWELTGYIVETLTGKITIATGDIVIWTLAGRRGSRPAESALYRQGCRSLPEKLPFDFTPMGNLPDEVLGAQWWLWWKTGAEHCDGALAGEKTRRPLYRGDRVELKKEANEDTKQGPARGPVPFFIAFKGPIGEIFLVAP